MRGLAQALGRFVAHEDPLTASLNTVALVLAGNTPFYPIYLWAVLGSHAASSILLTTVSLPFWLAVPLIARRSGYAARLVLCVVGTLNTIWCSYVLGFDSGVALFLIPCVMLSTLGFHHQERRTMLLTAALPFLAYGVIRLVPVGPATIYPVSDYGHLVTLNAFSVACLTGFLGLSFTGARPTRTQ